MPIAPNKSQTSQLAASLRQRIVDGEFGPGRRLPTFLEIESEYSVSRRVAQMAIERLKNDGFIRTATRRGLFVDHNPPHLTRYGIVFPVVQADPAWSIFDDVLVREARVLEKSETSREFEVFAGTEDYREGADVRRRLCEDVASDRLAGLILAGRCSLGDGRPSHDSALPKVVLFGDPESSPDLVVTGDGDSIIDRSLEHLARQGCRRIAVFRPDGAYSSIGEKHFSRHGLTFRPQWLQVIGRGDRAVLGALVPLLMDYPEGERPDGLVVIDDNLVDHVVAALIEAGIGIGRDIQMVAHSNWPARSPNVLPIRRIGFHVGKMLDCCVGAIDMQREGKAPPRVQRVAATFEDELVTA